ncbi:MAG: DUF262 domain-containing protein [Saprospiraceae bacterium]|nr:DUF262 domain-containing protein [Saprospiraceae bacterium]
MSQTISTFDSTKEPLADLLKAIHNGKIQLPDFQRGWVWDDYHIVSLLGSLGTAYPIGAIMVLETGNPDVKFKTRLIEGVQGSSEKEAERLILDGQQRLTSLYQSLFSNAPVKTRDSRGNEIDRLYYIDIRKSLDRNYDLEEAVLSLPPSKQVVNFRNEVQEDYSTQQLEWKHEVFPLNIVFDVNRWNTWQTGYLQAEGNEKMLERLNRWNQFFGKVLQAIQQYNVPVIKLNKETPKAAICQVFEKVNTGGVSLTVFELLTATFAIDDFNLRDDWTARTKKFKEQAVLKNLPNDNFLQGNTLLTSYTRRFAAEFNKVKEEELPAVTCKRKDILRLELEDYTTWAEKLQQGFINTAKFLHTQNIFSDRDIPYSSQLVPLAVILVLAGDKMDNDGIRSKVKRWFWCGVLGELYGSATETRFAKDVYEVMKWINGGEEPSTVKEANFYPSRLLSLRSRGSAAYKGIYALMMQTGSLDFRSGEAINSITYFEEAVDIHHIFPKKWCTDNNIESKIYDSIINKTPISYKTNRKIGGHAPSIYLEKLRSENNDHPDPLTRQREILSTHTVQADHLQSDDFTQFYNLRAKAILAMISNAMGKPVNLEAGKEILDL